MTDLICDPPPDRIILVEDNEDDRFMVEYMITSVSPRYTVDTFELGTQALDSFDVNSASCVIVDYRLETEDGLTLLADFKKYDPFVPVILLTGQGSEELATLSIKSGASDYLVKENLTEIGLRAAIHNAVTQSQLEKKIAIQAREQKVFLEVLVHDLKAPLLNIQRLSGVALEDEADGKFDDLRMHLNLQSNIAGRANELIDTLEKYTCLDGEFEFESVSLSYIVQSTQENLGKVILDSHAQLIFDDLPSVTGNAPLLIQMLQNLVHNSLRYNESDIPVVEITSSTTDADSIVLTVSDNGIGIPEDDVKRIFNPFKRLWAYSQYKGSGLGLATCSKIVQLHDGNIWCTSQEGKGSQFHVRLPVPKLAH